MELSKQCVSLELAKRLKVCPKCLEKKPVIAFYERKNYRWQSERYHSYCKACSLERRKLWYWAQGGKLKRAIAGKARRDANPQFFQEKRRLWHWTAKITALSHYGAKCVCCGEVEPKFLAIDHIKGNGNKHRKTLGTMTIYRWLKKHNYPKGFQVLCHNCNMAKAFWKECPHEARKSSVQFRTIKAAA